MNDPQVDQLPLKLIVDTDCGTDDLLALAFLASNPRVELLAVTTVHGLTRASRGAENVLRVLARLGKKAVPVIAGAELPLYGQRTFPNDFR